MTTSLTLPSDAAVDLHLHTLYSDGKWRPADLFDALAQGGFRLVSIVDHDQLAHLPEVLALGAERGIAVIPGVEVTVEWHGMPAHLLCYAPLGSDFGDDRLSALMDDTASRMRANTRMIYDAMLARGYRFPRQNEILASQRGEPVRARDVADLLVAHGYVASLREALQMVTKAGYQQMCAPLAQVVEAAHAGGGVTLLAHPGRGEGEILQWAPADIEALLAEVPLDGIEVYYPTHTPEQINAYESLARGHGLLVSAGSDSHAPQQRMPVAYPASRIASLLERLGAHLHN